MTTRKQTFGNLRTTDLATRAHDAYAKVAAIPVTTGRQASREGRKQVAGFFTPEMSNALHGLARRRGIKLQDLMVEAFDDVLRKHGDSPLGG